MKSLGILAIYIYLLMAAACSKQSGAPSNATTSNPATTQTPAAKPSAITVSINNSPMRVDSINYFHSYSPGSQTGGFYFSAQNALQKVTGTCFYFYQQSRWNYQYSDSVTYATRATSLSPWNSLTAIGYGNVYFDALYAPLTDSIVGGNYNGQFAAGKQSLNISGTFYLVFK